MHSVDSTTLNIQIAHRYFMISIEKPTKWCVFHVIVIFVNVCECFVCLTDWAIVPDDVRSPDKDVNEHIVAECIVVQLGMVVLVFVLIHGYCLKSVFVSLSACSCICMCMCIVCIYYIIFDVYMSESIQVKEKMFEVK